MASLDDANAILVDNEHPRPTKVPLERRVLDSLLVIYM